MRTYKKAISGLAAAAMLLLLCIAMYAATPQDWAAVKGSYSKEGNSALQSGVLSLMYLDNDVVMFEFFMFEKGWETSQDKSFCLAGAFYLDEDGIGIYEHPKTENVRLNFEINGDTVTVKQTGALPMAVGGIYRFVSHSIEVTDAAAAEILEQLPTAATSLNHNNGEYMLWMSPEMVDGWFYDVKAIFVDTNALLAEFYIAADMSAVYRVDTDAPMLIWGTAQPMLDATYTINAEALLGTTAAAVDANSDASDGADSLLQASYVSIAPESEVLTIGGSTRVIVTVPGGLSYALKCQSSAPALIKVDERGVITANSAGEAAITITVTIDDAEKTFVFTVRAFE